MDEDSRAPASIDYDYDPNTRLFDRMLKARPEKSDPSHLAQARGLIHGYQCKFGRFPDAHPPDSLICAQLLAVAPLHQLEALIYELMGERKQPGDSYGWYLTVAMQRIHGISPQRQAKTRAALRVVRPQAAAAAAAGASSSTQPGSPAEPAFDFDATIQRLAQAKAL
jgi:hypothetical protein